VEWRTWVVRWEATQHTTPEDSPFEYEETDQWVRLRRGDLG
jgi:hypothetical protein